MPTLNANIIYDSSPYAERLIKFSMFYFDKVDIHFPDTCGTIVTNLPKKITEVKNFFLSGNHANNFIDVFSFYEKSIIQRFEQLSLASNLKTNSFINGRLIANYSTKILGIPDGQGRIVYNRQKTEYSKGDSPWERLARWNKDKKESAIMGIIEKNIQSLAFNNAIQHNGDGFFIEENDSGLVLVDDDILSMFNLACNDEVVEYLYQYYGEYVYEYDYLKLYTWLQEYYYIIVSYFFNVLSSSDNVIIADKILSNILTETMNLNNINSAKKYLASEHIFKILVPDYFNLEYDDIYELKLCAKDELMALKYYIHSLGSIESVEDAERAIQTKVNPSIKELENKIVNMRIGLVQKALREVRNPVAYLPLLSSLVTNIDQKLAMAVTFGVMGADLALEYYKEKKNIKNHPMFFRIGLNKKIAWY